MIDVGAALFGGRLSIPNGDVRHVDDRAPL
jgi:hypothetical protein